MQFLKAEDQRADDCDEPVKMPVETMASLVVSRYLSHMNKAHLS